MTKTREIDKIKINVSHSVVSKYHEYVNAQVETIDWKHYENTHS